MISDLWANVSLRSGPDSPCGCQWQSWCRSLFAAPGRRPGPMESGWTARLKGATPFQSIRFPHWSYPLAALQRERTFKVTGAGELPRLSC